jgi:hypothetical protein
MTARFDDIEHCYEALAVAIDQAGAEQEAMFLVKLALVLAERLANPAEFDACIAVTLKDLSADRVL